MGIILSHRCLVDHPGQHARSGAPALNHPPPVTAAKEGGGGGVGRMSFPITPPPRQSNFLPAQSSPCSLAQG